MTEMTLALGHFSAIADAALGVFITTREAAATQRPSSRSAR
jgi:hypothetical protein